MLVSTIYGLTSGGKMLKEAKGIKPLYTSYADILKKGSDPNNPADVLLGMTQMQLNAQDPFAAAQQRGILGSQAGAMASAQRSVTDPAQALAMTSAIQGNTNQALFQQGLQNQQNYQQRLSGLAGALQGKSAENRYQYENLLQKYMMDLDRKTALQNAGRQTQLGAIQGFETAAIDIAKALINPASAVKKG